MAGSAAIIRYDGGEFTERIAAIVERMGSAQPALEIIGETLTASVQKNFEAGGRPNGWQPLSPATMARKKGGSILVGKGIAGGLLGSIHFEVEANVVYIGTDKEYAAAHQFGCDDTVVHDVEAHTRRIKTAFGRPIAPREIAVMAHQRLVTMNIPARPYLMVQDEDVEEVIDLLGEFILTGQAE